MFTGSRLVGDVDAGLGTELARPHAGAVHHDLGLDVALRRRDPGDDAALPGDAGDGYALDDGDALLAGALGERHGHVDRVGAPVLLDVEAGEDVVSAGEGEEIADLRRRDLVDGHAAQAVEGGDPAVLLETVGVAGALDEADRLPAGRLAGLGLEPGVEIARVLAHLRRGLGGRAEGHHEPRRVPGGARGEAIALEEDDVLPAHVAEVIGDGAADDAATDDDDAGALGKDRCGHCRPA